MRRIAWVLAAALAPGAPLALADDTLSADGFETPWVSGYTVGYQRDGYPVEAIDFSVVTHLLVGRVTPRADGTLTTHFDIDPVAGPAWARQSAAAARAAGRHAVLMVGGAGEHAGWVAAAAPAQRERFVANLLQAVDDFGFDGLDLDWEPLPAEDQPAFLALAEALRAARPDLLLSVPLGWINANFATPADPFYGRLAPLFDQINVMSYDMAGGWDGWLSWHSAALDGATGTTPSSVTISVDYYRRAGVPRDRLGIGIPFYGTCWRGVDAPRQSGGFVVASDNVLSYRHLVADYYAPERAQWDAQAQVPWLGAAQPFGPAGCRFVSYDDAASIAAKVAYLRRHGLGGTIVWTLAQGHLPDRPPGQRDPLLQALGAALR